MAPISSVLLLLLTLVQVLAAPAIPPHAGSGGLMDRPADDDPWGWDYAVMVDAGSTGSRAYVYRWSHQKTGQRVFIEPETKEKWTLAIKPGISSYASMPSAVGASLQQLLDFAEAVILDEGTAPERLKTFHV